MTDLNSGSMSASGSLADFVRALTTSGAVQVNSGDLLPDDEGEVLPVLESAEALVRDELAFEAPSFDPAAAIWAARQFYHACRFLVCRDIPAADVTRQLGLPCPQSRQPATDYSVDLIFRFLPQLLHVAERSASDDALTLSLRAWAKDWPLSSVGARIDGPFTIDSFVAMPALLQLYTDRIVQHVAVDRLDDSRVVARIQADLGAYPDLAPAIVSALNRAFAAPVP